MNNTLKARAQLFSDIRRFFAERDVLEVDTPLLAPSVIADPQLAILSCTYAQQTWFLQPSPEAAMKRLLAAGSGAIYQICKAFRDDEQGRLHQAEFTLLEWYRPGYDHHQLMDEVDALLQSVLQCEQAERSSYAALWRHHLDIDIQHATPAQLRALAEQHQIALQGELDYDGWLDLLMSHLLEPKLGQTRPLFVYDYPASQAALARLRQDSDISVAERFEVYYRGIELANGFHELCDATEQRQRFAAWQSQRQAQGKPLLPLDEAFLAALEKGLPACAGVALGIDRLLMLQQGCQQLTEILSFAH